MLANSRFAGELEIIYPQRLCGLAVRCLAVFFGISYQPPIPVAAARGEETRTIRVNFQGDSGHGEDEAVGADLQCFGTTSGASGDGPPFVGGGMERGRSSMVPDVERVMSSKKILLFGEMVREVSFPTAAELVHCMSARFPVEGPMPVTDIFPKVRRKALFLPQKLWLRSARVRAALEAAAGPSGDRMLDEAVEKITLEEVQAGWLSGLHSAEPLDAKLGQWLPSRRFGIIQSGKSG